MDNNKPSMFDFSLDDLTQYSTALSGLGAGSSSGITSINDAIINNLFGINHRQTALPIPQNRDHYGLTFFTRPQLNLMPENIRNSRKFFPLLTNNPASYQAYVRAMLDPRSVQGWGGYAAKPAIFADEKQAFIPILTNHLVGISGWRDIVLPTYTSSEGVYKEAWSIGDGVSTDYGVYDINATFRNSIGDPITELMYYWVHYISCVFEGILDPYPDFMLLNEIDYNTRIYRLVLDKSKKYVQRIYATGASFPTNVPVGSMGDFAIDKPYNDVNAEITIQFRSMGCIYNDEILFHCFNKTAGVFNPQMRDVEPTEKGSIPEGSGVTKVDQALLPLFNNRGYPYINTKTYELEWYVDTDYLTRKLQAFGNMQNSIIPQNSELPIIDDTGIAQDINTDQYI